MTRSEGYKILHDAKARLIDNIHAAISDYKQFGMTLPQIETQIQAQNWREAKTQIQACFAHCPGCDLPIVNPDGDVGQVLAYINDCCTILIKNRALIAQLDAMSPAPSRCAV